ncbi:ATP-binding cassette domain-containing protein [Antarcticibacterium sp. 1MA-6-2]|uniref:ABC transporter ATP-binding protein n=1 Tax=Antarcticibacterium sp. 1MA-6-2 TaxID=2908210 RepID=UPI001F307B76|nr:ATP-binding cassette domain-containing protein [Antarcticibacterium sp. 1MA-6-2]UJH91306.1 ATP-binding cassette domain-containing protein [Antarcticibacterium sp. 1MA-6-2]
MKESVLKIEKSNVKIGVLDSILMAAREPLLILVVVIVIYVQTEILGSSLAQILASLFFFYRALSFLMQMQARWNKFLGVASSLENMQAFTKELKENKETQSKNSLKDTVKEMTLSNVSFYYGDTPVLKNINLKIPRNETIAFVGESGSGKTTLVNIIAGLLPVDKGDYYINDQKSSEVNMANFQERIGYITQDPVIFSDTLYNNVTFWADSSEDKERFWKSLQQAAILDFVNGLPDKEQTILGNNGVNLSGGQKQRLSIARELFKEVEILILDEATSALDSETEKEIQKNIDDLKGNYTILIVAHRISTIKNSDRIIVMKNGSIENIGNFEELMESSVKFKKMVELQEV